MWKYTRLSLALLCLAGFIVLFMQVHESLPPYLAFLAKFQLVPAFLSGSLAIVALLLGLTLLLGRVYCSVLCPLGLLQDAISRCSGRRRFRYQRGKTVLRALMLALFVGSLVAGMPLIVGLLEPYSAFGRIAADLFAPVWGMGHNTLAVAAARLDSVAFAPVPIWQKGLSALAGAVLTLGIISVLAWRNGRLWCNSLCPVGTMLGLLGRFALIRPRIHAESCTHCGQCATVCKASCIDPATASIDASRCVACFNCQDRCHHGALTFLPMGQAKNTGLHTTGAARKENIPQAPQAHTSSATPHVASLPPLTKVPPLSTEPTAPQKSACNPSRRALLLGLTTSLAALPAHAAVRGQDVVVPALTRKERPSRLVPISPPGSRSLSNFSARCTGCQLCVAACPHQTLRAQDTGAGMLQPTMSFEYGFCRVNCVSCSTVCPTGAIRPITVEEKSATQIGRVVIKHELCIVGTDKVTCTACARICPPGAITLVGEGEHKIPAVDNERCTGCGACEYVCPARPFAAIRVEGNRDHRRI